MARVFVLVTALSADRVIKAKVATATVAVGDPIATVWSTVRNDDGTPMNVVVDNSNIVEAGDTIKLEMTTAGEPVLDDGGNVQYEDEAKTIAKTYTKTGLKFRGRTSITSKIAVAKQQLALKQIEKETSAL